LTSVSFSSANWT